MSLSRFAYLRTSWGLEDYTIARHFGLVGDSDIPAGMIVDSDPNMVALCCITRDDLASLKLISHSRDGPRFEELLAEAIILGQIDTVEYLIPSGSSQKYRLPDDFLVNVFERLPTRYNPRVVKAMWTVKCRTLLSVGCVMHDLIRGEYTWLKNMLFRNMSEIDYEYLVTFRDDTLFQDHTSLALFANQQAQLVLAGEIPLPQDDFLWLINKSKAAASWWEIFRMSAQTSTFIRPADWEKLGYTGPFTPKHYQAITTFEQYTQWFENCNVCALTSEEKYKTLYYMMSTSREVPASVLTADYMQPFLGRLWIDLDGINVRVTHKTSKISATPSEQAPANNNRLKSRIMRAKRFRIFAAYSEDIIDDSDEYDSRELESYGDECDYECVSETDSE